MSRSLQGDVEISHHAERSACSPWALEIAPQTGKANRLVSVFLAARSRSISDVRGVTPATPVHQGRLISRFCSTQGFRAAPSALADRAPSQPSHPPGGVAEGWHTVVSLLTAGWQRCNPGLSEGLQAGKTDGFLRLGFLKPKATIGRLPAPASPATCSSRAFGRTEFSRFSRWRLRMAGGSRPLAKDP